MRRLILAAAVVVASSMLMGASGGGCGDSKSATSCAAGNYSCGPGGGPAGGPACCPAGYNCCFGHGVCCDENHPYLSGGKCWSQMPSGSLDTICGKPAG